MAEYDLVIRNGTIVTASDTVRCDVGVKGGIIATLGNSVAAAFLLMWISVEALLRHIATREGLPLERVPSSSLLKELFSLGILSRSELEVAQRAFAVRNALVHGFATTRLDETARDLAQFAQKLLLELDRIQK